MERCCQVPKHQDAGVATPTCQEQSGDCEDVHMTYMIWGKTIIRFNLRALMMRKTQEEEFKSRGM